MINRRETLKEKINLLSKGIFEYGCPDIHVSEESIYLEVEAGSSFSGEFRVYATNGIDVRAKVFSSNKQMRCAETDIIGTDNRIHFTFMAENMEPGDKAGICAFPLLYDQFWRGWEPGRVFKTGF